MKTVRFESGRSQYPRLAHLPRLTRAKIHLSAYIPRTNRQAVLTMNWEINGDLRAGLLAGQPAQLSQPARLAGQPSAHANWPHRPARPGQTAASQARRAGPWLAAPWLATADGRDHQPGGPSRLGRLAGAASQASQAGPPDRAGQLSQLTDLLAGTASQSTRRPTSQRGWPGPDSLAGRQASWAGQAAANCPEFLETSDCGTLSKHRGLY